MLKTKKAYEIAEEESLMLFWLTPRQVFIIPLLAMQGVN